VNNENIYGTNSQNQSNSHSLNQLALKTIPMSNLIIMKTIMILLLFGLNIQILKLIK
jgi:hypothetical protein